MWGWAAPKTWTTRARALSVPARMSRGVVASQAASIRITLTTHATTAHDVGVNAVPQRDGCNGCAWLTALPNHLEFELRTVKPSLGDFRASFARYGVHDLHRAHYRHRSAFAQNVFTGRIRWIALACSMTPVCRRGDLQCMADRLDPESRAVLVNEGVHFF